MFKQVSVILFAPQIPENAGFIARNMMAFGFSNLRIVAPRFVWNEQSPAYKTACGSGEILLQATVFDHFQDAVKDAHYVAGFSRRHHSPPTTHLYLEQWMQQIHSIHQNQKISLVLGSEDVGLPREITSLCTHVVEIPQSHQTLSLNLSHAAAIVLYTYYLQYSKRESNINSVENQTSINQEQIIRLTNAISDIKNHDQTNHPGKQCRHHDILLNFLQRSDITKDEYSVLMGYLSK